MLAALALLELALVSEPLPQVPAPSAGAGEAVRFERLHYRDRVERDGRQIREIEVKVHLGTAQGVAEFGQVGLLYIDGYGDVRFEDVVIEKPDSRRVEVKTGVVEDLNPFGVSGTSLPADLRFKKLTIPGLEPGDRLSYRMLNRQKALAPGHAFGEMKLPAVVGGALQTYELDLPRDAGIKVRLREGLDASWEEVPSSADRLVRRLTLKVELPTVAQPEITKDDLRKWVEPDVIFTSFRSWSEVSGWWWEISKDRLKPDTAVAKEASGLAEAATAPREKISALHAFLAARIRYLNVSFGLGRMQPRPAPDVLLNRYGDCKDKHALLAALAASLGLDVRPVLINSVRAALWDEVPSPQQFDHMISVVRLGPEPSDLLWLDATNPFGGPGHLMPQLRDKRALLIEPTGESVLVRTPKDPPFVPRQEVALKAVLSPEGVLRGRITWLFRSDAEFLLRAFFGSVPQEARISAAKETLAKDWGEVIVENVIVSDPLDVSSPFRVEFDVEKAIPANGSERALWVPFPEFDLPEAFDPVPGGSPAVSFDVRDVTARAEIEIPEGHRAHAPLSLSLERPFGTFRSTYSVEGRTLKLERILALSQPSVPEADAASYESFRNAVRTDRKQEFSIAFTAVALAAGSGGAEGLRRDGLAAFANKDYAKAVALLQKATEIDPKVKNGFRDLGRALYELGENEDSVAAFTREIETTPFHESAYAWRAYVLDRLNRGAEAEKDLAKQIEVAPFEVWSYERLGDRRLRQQRYDEASELYARAAAVEPKVSKRWVDLAVAQARAGRQDEARRSLDQAAVLDPSDQLKMTAAITYHFIGDLIKAGDLAESALPWLSGRLARMSPDDFDEGDLYWTTRLVDAWSVIGDAAAVGGDSAKAERFLRAAWRLGFSPKAGWALGDLCEKQGRLADAVELWSMAAAVPTAAATLPEDRQSRIEAACKKLPAAAPSPALVPDMPSAIEFAYARPRPQVEAEARLLELRTVRLNGPAIAEFTEEVLLLANADGLVERVTNLSRKKPEVFDRQLAKLDSIRLNWLRPDERAWKAARPGLLACNPASGCAVVLDMPGLSRLPSGDLGSIRITSLEPTDGSTLAPGQRVTVTATVHYQLYEDQGAVALVIQDQSGKSLFDTLIGEVVRSGTGDLTLSGSFTVPVNATRIDVLLPLAGSTRGATITVAAAKYDVR